MLSQRSGVDVVHLNDGDDLPLSPGSIPEGPSSAAPGPRTRSPDPQGFSQVEDLESLAGEEGDEKLLDGLDVGVIVFDHSQNLRYCNRAQAHLLGTDLRKSGDMEEWLRSGCRDDAYARRVIDAWREHVWQKQLKRVFSLKNADDRLREIEFRPRLLKNGDLLLTVLDVTERRQAEDALRLVDTKFNAVFHQVGSGLALVDRTGRFLEVNSAFEALLGYSRAELRRMSLNDCVAFSDIERLRGAEALLATEEGQVADSTLLSRHDFSGGEAIRFRPSEGEPFPAGVTLSLVRGPEGQALFTLLSTHHEAESGRLCERSRALLEAIPDLILVLDRDGTVNDVMPANGDGWRGAVASPKWVGKNISECWPAFDASAVARVSEAIDGCAVRSWRLPEKSGSMAHYAVRATACGEDRAVVLVMDATDEAEAREALVRQGLAFRNLEEAIIVTDLRGRITDCNAAAEQIFGYELGEISGEGLATLYAAPDRIEGFNREISRALTESGRWEGRRNFYRKDGSSGQAEVCFLPVEESGEPRSLLGIHRESRGRSLDLDVVDQVQHRWRNQLQTIGSLLNLERFETSGEDKVERSLLLKVQCRLKAISRLHECVDSVDDWVPLVRYGQILAEDIRRVVAGLKGESEDGTAMLDVRESEDAEAEPVTADFETATIFGLYLTELFLAVLMKQNASDPPAKLVLRLFEGHPMMEANVPSEAMAALSVPILKCLTEQLRGSLQVSHRDGRAEWLLRFPAAH